MEGVIFSWLYRNRIHYNSIESAGTELRTNAFNLIRPHCDDGETLVLEQRKIVEPVLIRPHWRIRGSANSLELNVNWDICHIYHGLSSRSLHQRNQNRLIPGVVGNQAGYIFKNLLALERVWVEEQYV